MGMGRQASERIRTLINVVFPLPGKPWKMMPRKGNERVEMLNGYNGRRTDFPRRRK